jgi:hypothetical protein
VRRISWHFTEESVFSPGFWYVDWGDPVNEGIVTLTQAVSMADTPMWCIHEHGLVLRRIIKASESLLDDLDQALSHDFDEPRPVAADSPLAGTVLSAYQSLHHTYILLVDALVECRKGRLERDLRNQRDEAAELCLVMADAYNTILHLRRRLPDDI